MRSDAVISPDGLYRYRLTRDWAERPDLANPSPDRTLAFLMLNPSTADAVKPDPTIRRCIGFAIGEGFTAITVVNLYAFRTAKPKVLWKEATDLRIGPDNDDYIRLVAMTYPKVVAAWGAQAPSKHLEKRWHLARIAEVQELFKQMKAPLCCLGRTKEGEPRHPLMVRGMQMLEPYP